MFRGILALTLALFGCDGDVFSRRGGAPTHASADDAGMAADATPDDSGAALPVALLSSAFMSQQAALELLHDPGIDRDDAASLRAAVARAAPLVAAVEQEIMQAQPLVAGEVGVAVDAARDATGAELAVAGVVADDAPERVLLRYDELVAHAAVALESLNVSLSLLGAGPSAPGEGHVLHPADLTVAGGAIAEVVTHQLTFPSAVAVGDDGLVYVAEAGDSYGRITAEARILAFERGLPNARVVAGGFEPPIAGLVVVGDVLFVSHRGAISRVEIESGAVTDVVTGLPSFGDHPNAGIALGPDGLLYFTQGSATNSGVVGLDSYVFGWLQTAPAVSEIPCRDVRLAGRGFRTGNPLSGDPRDVAVTGAFLPFGIEGAAGEVVRGRVPCTGAVLRVRPDGSGLEAFADGLRNPYGLAFHPDGRLFVTENGPDVRGSRPVEAPDNLYALSRGGWYGFPDFYGGLPVWQPAYHRGRPPAAPVLLGPPSLAGLPAARFEPHAAAAGLDFAPSGALVPAGSAVVAELGELAPLTTGGAASGAGHRVVTVSADGAIAPLLTSVAGPDGKPFLRPVDVAFDASGRTLYVVHFGQLRTVPGGVLPVAATGALIRIRPPGG